ncbi:non-canonical purine NTP pyrophosphatase [Deinococcus cellulosilyticus]|uniref:Non-canonical purine NTP pyrophosphatase n=1 Tax=Deinococcus cellulosilyticus (strain DSM 18568 / NBRC 106333 / KACC 11606 / 5516J-15) TaxID=1223518 RepID=A0A511MXN0_DEIC1|nr:non-canonical purine NTP pyrophosphatase [Deinococcus cellulosilyticus]GEM45355.1 non-canonical purine NTP pyrophosphatase [Deinococcus cellulosilyticus NBRC 106333 = KACC 11606]
MPEVLYLTTNPGKAREARDILIGQYGLNLQVESPPFEIPEIQSDSCAKVALFSARFAADRLGQPCLVSDTGLYLDCLGGLPGPYNAHFDRQIGVEKFLRLIQHEANRMARLENCFACCEPGQEPVVFSGGSTGSIAFEPRGNLGRWHELFYIPDGEERTLSELRQIDPGRESQYWGGAIHEMGAWLRRSSNHKPLPEPQEGL